MKRHSFLVLLIVIWFFGGEAGHLFAQADRRIDVNTGVGNPTSGGLGSRVALLVGNAAYQNVPPLSNPLNDVRSFASVLREVGFEVIIRENADLRSLDEAVQDFWNRLKGKDVGLFYYSGHGMQVSGENFLVPVSASIEKEMDIRYNCYQAQKILDYMDDAKAKTNIVILDACRNNPFKRGSRSASMGLARMDAVGQMFVAYATDPDKVANDGDPGGNSPYMRHILKNIKTPGLPVEMLFKEVRSGVLDETGNKQRPWELSCLTRNFSFVPAGVQQVSAPAQLPTINEPSVPHKPVVPADDPIPETSVAVPTTSTPEPQPKSRWDRMWDSLTGGSTTPPVSTGGGGSLKSRAESGDGQAQYELGVQYLEGREVPKDTLEALKWLRLSGDAGVASGQCKLGWMYETGTGVACDLNEARKWFTRAADQGNLFAQKSLKKLSGKTEKAQVQKKAKVKKPLVANKTGSSSSSGSPAPVVQKPTPSAPVVSTPKPSAPKTPSPAVKPKAAPAKKPEDIAQSLQELREAGRQINKDFLSIFKKKKK